MTSTFFSLNTLTSFFYFSRWFNITLISSFIFIDLLHSVPDNFFLFRAFKDFQGCQESQERGAQGWVFPVSKSFPFHLCTGHLSSITTFQSTLQKSCICVRVPSDASVLSTPWSLPIYRSPLSVFDQALSDIFEMWSIIQPDICLLWLWVWSGCAPLLPRSFG